MTTTTTNVRDAKYAAPRRRAAIQAALFMWKCGECVKNANAGMFSVHVLCRAMLCMLDM